MIYVSRDYESNLFSFDTLPNIIDHIWVIINISRNRQLLLGCVYNPPGHMTHLDAHLSDIMTKASDISTKHKVVGDDFNLSDLAWEQGGYSHRLPKLSYALENDDWVQQIRTPTRLNNIPDLLFTFDINELSVSIDIPLSSSDHNKVKATLSIPHDDHFSKSITQMRRDLKNLNEHNIH